MNNYLDLNNTKKRNHPSYLFLLACIGFTVWAIISSLLYRNTAIDIQLHDSYFVIQRASILIFIAFVMGFYSLLYYAIPKITKRALNEKLGKLHFGITSIGLLIIIFPIYYLLQSRTPRRYYRFKEFDSFGNSVNFNHFITIILIIVCFSQLIFVFNLIYSLLKRSS